MEYVAPPARGWRVTSWPYDVWLASATPYPGSATSTHRWAHTSNRAASQLVLTCVGRTTCPNWRLVGRVVGVDVAVDGELENPLPLVPVDVGVDLDAASVQPDPLHDARAAERPADHDLAALDRHGLGLGQVGDRAAVVGVEVPGVPAHRVVGVELEQVGHPAGGQRLATGLGIDDRADQAVGVEPDPEQVAREQHATVRLPRGLGGEP